MSVRIFLIKNGVECRKDVYPIYRTMAFTRLPAAVDGSVGAFMCSIQTETLIVYKPSMPLNLNLVSNFWVQIIINSSFTY